MIDERLRPLIDLLRLAESAGASDLHVSDKDGAALVVGGRLDPVDTIRSFPSGTVASWADAVLGAGGLAMLHGPDGYADMVAALSEDVSTRVAFRQQSKSVALTARLLPSRVPTLDELVVPDQIIDLVNRPNGLVLVSGPTGAGKSTLLAALINEVNTTQRKHVMTLESPIEYIHQSNKSRISQRLIGPVDCDAVSAASGLRSALRSRPDIIVVGELLTVDDVRAALDASTKGHLVFTTSHAGSVSDAIASFVGSFPAQEQPHAASRLAASLQAVVVQQLLPALDGGQVAARELMLRSPGIAQQIRAGNYQGIYNALTSKPNAEGEIDGMFRFESELVRLVEERQLDLEVARQAANNPEDFINMLNARNGQV